VQSGFSKYNVFIYYIIKIRVIKWCIITSRNLKFWILFVKYCDFMGEITCTKCELARKPTMCAVKINFILLIWALSVNCMDMPWVQSHAQSEDYRNPLCAILYTHRSNNFHKVRTCRSSLCTGLCTQGWNHLHMSGIICTKWVLQPTLCTIVCT
jgi:hypothetical protein